MDREEIFESEGESSIVVSHSITAETATSASVSGDIVRDCLPPALEAFEYFHTTTYPTSTPGTIGGSRSVLESPYERYLRLKGELQDLSEQLSTSALVEEHGKASIWAYLAEETKRLSEQSDVLAQHPAWKSLQGSQQVCLHDEVLQDISAKLAITNTTSTTTTSTATTLTKATNKNDYDLHTRNQKTLLQLEQRIYRLETLLGIHDVHAAASSTALSGGFPLVQLITRLEQKLSVMDHTSLDAMKTKVHGLKVEIDAILHHSTPSTSSSSSSVSAANASNSNPEVTKVMEAIKKVDHIVEMVTKIEHVLEDLPVILLRLKTLEGIHWSASTVATRLNTLEHDVNTLTQEVHNYQQIMIELKAGLKENLQVLQDNMQSVEERLKNL